MFAVYCSSTTSLSPHSFPSRLRVFKGPDALPTDQTSTSRRIEEESHPQIHKPNMSRTLRLLALGAAVKLALAGTLKTCSFSSPLSCSSSSTSASCCYESPGGLLLQTQFWDYSPSIGPSDSWGIHGLWCVQSKPPSGAVVHSST